MAETPSTPAAAAAVPAAAASPAAKELTPGQLKALEREKRKAEAAAKRGGGGSKALLTVCETHGDLPLSNSATRPGATYHSLATIKPNDEVLLRARVQAVRPQGNLVFVVLRQGQYTIQCVCDKKTAGKPFLDYVAAVTKESIVNAHGRVLAAEKLIGSTTCSGLEISLTKLFVVSRAQLLPMQLEDASRPKKFLEHQNAEIALVEKDFSEAKEALASKDKQRIKALGPMLEKQFARAKTAPQNAKALSAVEAALAVGLLAVNTLSADEVTDAAGEAAAEDVVKTFIYLKENARTFVDVGLETLLNNRVIDLRTRANWGIFRIQSAVGTLFREYLLSQQFVEIHTPKMIAGASEGGANVFELKYFDRSAFLAQSPQLFKQMAVCGGLERVFEVGPVFRAEKSFTPRHLTEFTGLDMEMAITEHYHEVLEMMDGMFLHIFNGLNDSCKAEIEAVREQWPFEDLKYNRDKTLRLTFAEGIKLLQENGRPDIDPLEDLGTEDEKLLGRLVEAKFNTEFYVLDKFPAAARPFYTMLDAEDPNYTNSYDLFVRHQEIVSGAQRIHDPALLSERALAKGVAPESIQTYIDGFKYGAPPHGGCGVGLERVVFLFLGLHNVRHTSMFPRDPTRLTP